jgi:hypothetical protein
MGRGRLALSQLPGREVDRREEGRDIAAVCGTVTLWSLSYLSSAMKDKQADCAGGERSFPLARALVSRTRRQSG